MTARAPARQTERVLVYAIVRAAEALVDAPDLNTMLGAVTATVEARRAWWRRRSTRARRPIVSVRAVEKRRRAGAAS